MGGKGRLVLDTPYHTGALTVSLGHEKTVTQFFAIQKVFLRDLLLTLHGCRLTGHY